MVYVEAGRKRYFLTNHQIVFNKESPPGTMGGPALSVIVGV
jgi:hypothetical protein